jgi:cysteinyl-tRNA synthetase
LLDFDRVFGLQLAANTTTENPEEIKELAKERKQARENEAYEKADSLRKEIESHGYSVRDTDNGQEILPK